MKKGFFFSVVALVLLIYVFSSLTYKMESVKEQSKTYKESIRLASYELIYSQLSRDNIENYLEVISYYALLKMADHTAKHPIKEGSSSELEYVEEVFSQLFNNGKADPSLFSDGVGITYSNSEIEGRTLTGLRDKFGAILRENGLILNKMEATISSIRMISPYKVIVEGIITIDVSDIYETSSFSYLKNFEVEVDIEGFPDPLVNNYLNREGLSSSYERYIFKPKNTPSLTVYKFNSDPSNGLYYYDFPEPEKKRGAVTGRGWFYGEVFDLSEISDTNRVPPSKRGLYILAGRYDDIKGYTDFGAYIYTDDVDDVNAFISKINHNKPFILYPNFKKSSFSYPQSTDPRGELALLFISEKDDNIDENTKVRVYKIEFLRDSVICSYYFSPPSFGTQEVLNLFSSSKGSPSFLQRMLEDAYKRTDTKNGLVSFLVGTEYGGVNSPNFEDFSKLDFEFVGEYFGNPLTSYSFRGLPACKNREMCSINDVSVTGVAEIKISQDNLNTMWSSSSSMQEISCNSGGSSCE